MATFDICGEWEGEYSYSPCEGLPIPPSPTRFTLTARAGWFRAFRGVIRDDPTGGPPEPATVKGRVVGLGVTIVKRYPTLFLYHGGRCVSLREYLQAEEARVLDTDVPGPPIIYQGTFDPVGQRVTGTWQFRPARLRFRSGGRLGEARLPGSLGRWTMGRLLPV